MSSASLCSTTATAARRMWTSASGCTSSGVGTAAASWLLIASESWFWCTLARSLPRSGQNALQRNTPVGLHPLWRHPLSRWAARGWARVGAFPRRSRASRPSRRACGAERSREMWWLIVSMALRGRGARNRRDSALGAGRRRRRCRRRLQASEALQYHILDSNVHCGISRETLASSARDCLVHPVRPTAFQQKPPRAGRLRWPPFPFRTSLHNPAKPARSSPPRYSARGAWRA